MDKEPRIDFRNDAAIFRNLWEMATQVPEHISLIEKKHDSPLVAQFIEEKLNKLIKRRELFFPNLQAHNDTVLVLSDYGGENSTSRYKVISFLICGYSPLLPF